MQPRITVLTLAVRDLSAPPRAWPSPPAALSGGGYAGYFQGPDGHLWEVAYDPAWESGG